MTKEFKTLQFYHIILISMLISPLLILNSNSMNKKRHQEKLIQNEMNNLFLRKLDFTSDTNKICEKGTEELREYYKTGDGEKLGLKEGKIESGDNPEHIDALVNLVSGEGDSTENATTYAMHLIPVIIFLAIAILSLPGWLICCICNCSNCCCCCCCKKPSCKLPFYIVTLVIYAFVAAICIYGLSQSNSIFVGLADTECSLLRFTGEVLDGETKEAIPKWIGISGIQKLFADTSYQIGQLTSGTKTSLEDNKRDANDAKTNFQDELGSQSTTVNGDSGFCTNFNDGDYCLDILVQFGNFNPSNIPSTPSYTLMDQWYYEYSQTATNVENTLDNIYENYKDLLNNKNSATSSLNQGIDSINEIRKSFDDVKDQISGTIIEYSDTIDEYGKLAFKIIFSVLLIIDLGIAGFITLLFFCSFQACQNCCIRCILKTFLHILWNVLALLTFFTLLFGFILTLFGIVGKDLISVVEYLVSDKNLDKPEPVLLGEASKYLKKCVNGNGDIKKELDLDLDSMNNIDQLSDALERIESAERNADSLNQKLALNSYKTDFDKRKNYAIDDIKLIRDDKGSSFKLSDYINNINSKQSLIHWSRSCPTTSGNCESISDTTTASSSDCVALSTCTTTDKIKSLYSGDNDIKDIANVLNAFIASIKNANSGTDVISGALTSLEDKYDDFITAEMGALSTYKTAIESLSSIFTGLTGNGGFSDILNCLFIGKNVKIILKNLEKSLGTNFYNVGVCLLTSGVAMLVSISFTILLNIILNTKDQTPGMK